MNYPANTILLYKNMMRHQNLGIFTEHHLLDFMIHFWYNGSYDEYYDTCYRKKFNG